MFNDKFSLKWRILSYSILFFFSSIPPHSFSCPFLLIFLSKNFCTTYTVVTNLFVSQIHLFYSCQSRKCSFSRMKYEKVFPRRHSMFCPFSEHVLCDWSFTFIYLLDSLDIVNSCFSQTRKRGRLHSLRWITREFSPFLLSLSPSLPLSFTPSLILSLYSITRISFAKVPTTLLTNGNLCMFSKSLRLIRPLLSLVYKNLS